MLSKTEISINDEMTESSTIIIKAIPELESSSLTKFIMEVEETEEPIQKFKEALKIAVAKHQDVSLPYTLQEEVDYAFNLAIGLSFANAELYFSIIEEFFNNELIKPNPNAIQHSGFAAMHLAINSQNEKIFDLLINNGGNLNIETYPDVSGTNEARSPQLSLPAYLEQHVTIKNDFYHHVKQQISLNQPPITSTPATQFSSKKRKLEVSEKTENKKNPEVKTIDTESTSPPAKRTKPNEPNEQPTRQRNNRSGSFCNLV